jgi:hypothetical protein
MTTLTKVSSSNISHVGHFGTTLTVVFAGGGRYEYADVPRGVYDQFMAAESKGGFFAKYIRGQFKHTQVKAAA